MVTATDFHGFPPPRVNRRSRNIRALSPPSLRFAHRGSHLAPRGAATTWGQLRNSNEFASAYGQQVPTSTAPGTQVTGRHAPQPGTAAGQSPITCIRRTAVAAPPAGGRGDPSFAFLAPQGGLASNWSGQLAHGNYEEQWAERLRHATRHGRPWGDDVLTGFFPPGESCDLDKRRGVARESVEPISACFAGRNKWPHRMSL